jgi:hypothetical protein
MKNRIQGWFDRGGSPVERELVEHRPEAPASLVRSISARIQQRPARSRVRVGFALGLTAAMVAAIGASGGLGYASSSIRDASSSISKLVHATTLAPARTASRSAGTPSLASQTHISAACTQYSALPHITNVSPVGARSGVQITINGSHFAGDSALDKVTFFNGVIVTSITRISDSQVKVTVPSAARNGALTVHNCKGTSNAVTFYTAPTITSITPSRAVRTQSVTIVGTNFASGHTTVKFGTAAASGLIFTGTTSIKVNVPTGSPLGTVTVTVTNPGNVTATKTMTVAPAPTVTNVTPTTALKGQTITVTGANYVVGKMTVEFFLGTTLKASVLATTGNTTTTTAKVAVPTSTALVAGSTYIIKIKDADGQSTATSHTVKLFPVPTLTKLSAASGKKGSSLTLTGANYVAGKMSVQFFQGTTLKSTVAVTTANTTATTAKITVPSTLTVGTTYNVKIKDADGTSAAKTYKVTG